MPKDLLEHLRMSCELAHDKGAKPRCLWCEAADEIEGLREDVAGYAVREAELIAYATSLHEELEELRG